VNVNVELDHSSVLSLAPALLLPVGAGAGVLEQAFQMVSYLEHSIKPTILPTNPSSNQLFFRPTIILPTSHSSNRSSSYGTDSRNHSTILLVHSFYPVNSSRTIVSW